MSRERRRLTARGRLAVTLTALLVALSVMLGAIVYVLMRVIPDYSFDTAPPTLVGPGDGGSAGGYAVPVLTVADRDDVLRTLLGIVLAAVLVVAIIGAATSWFVAGRTLRPLREINRAAQVAATGSLAHRVHLAGPRDEITDLARTVDLMLERLEASFNAQRAFAANASHELQTPLAAMKTVLDVAQRHPADTDWAALTAALQATTARSSAIVQALLDLADVDRTAVDHSPVDLTDTTAAVLDEWCTRADRADVRLRSQLDATVVSGDATLLCHLVDNLVGNAVRHNVPGGTVDVLLRSTPTGAALTVGNTGESVPPEAAELLVQPFHRLRRSAVRDGPGGHGLGLALCRSIVTAHEGSITIVANPCGGLTVSVHVPTEHRSRER